MGENAGIESQLLPVTMAGGHGPQCLDCIGEFMQWKQKHEKGEATQEEEPIIELAVTMAPSWQSMSVLNQTFYACVSVPACMRHLEVKELTPEERATRGGILLGKNPG